MLDTVKVRRLIKEKFGTHFAFGRAVGIDPTQISRYLRGKPISLHNAQRFAVGLCVTLNDILRHSSGVADTQ